MVFGVFDGLHEGHKDFLRQALRRCERLIVVLTVPEVVQDLKGKAPKYTYDERASALAAFNAELVVVPSHARLHSWEVLRTNRPDIVFLGYDQQAIAGELEKLGVRFEFLEAHRPDKFKSSLLN